MQLNQYSLEFLIKHPHPRLSNFLPLNAPLSTKTLNSLHLGTYSRNTVSKSIKFGEAKTFV